MPPRPALRAAAVAGTAPLVLLLASPALAATRDDGDDPAEPMSYLMSALVFVGIPLALVAVIALLTYLPSMSSGPRYRPGLGWWAAPVWFGGPASAETAIAAATPTTDGGGASARW